MAISGTPLTSTPVHGAMTLNVPGSDWPAGEKQAPATQVLRMKLPGGVAGAWCLVRVAASAPGDWWVKLDLSDGMRGHVVRQAFLGRTVRRQGRTWRSTLIHVPLDCDGVVLRLIGEGVVAGPVALRALGRLEVAWRLLLHGWRLLPQALSGEAAGIAGRARGLLGQAPARGGEPPPYKVWLALHDTPGTAERERLAAALAAAPVPSLQLVLLDPHSDPRGCDASLASVASQWWGSPTVPVATVAGAASWPALTADWIGVIEAGELLAGPALARIALAIQRSPELAFICADTDVQGVDGTRRTPRFKPSPGPLLIPSGLLTTGICAFRRSAVAWRSLPSGGDAVRLALARSLPDNVGLKAMLRLPSILTHLPEHAGSRMKETNDPAPMLPEADLPSISIIVPTAARSRHVLRCLRSLACGTDYPDFEIIVAASRIDPVDRRQARLLRRLQSLPRTRILDLGLTSFNYAEANNLAAASASGDCLLLLNDDVSPIEPLWLRRMASLLRGTTGIVGARLLYGNFTVQHAGVIMGLADLCEHDGRFLNNAAALPGVFDREISAVTGACMLVWTGLYRAIGGLDTDFAIALNDVDFCLRARKAGADTAYCAQAVLLHYESLSLGRHYAGDRAGLEAREVRLLRERWQAVIDGDPFYNPQASREPGREWQPGYPPAECVG